jgi:broad specificity phosphatase PhoE
MQKFFFIRHGETDWNVKLGKMQGHTDIPLNEVGLRQAAGLIELVKPLGFERIVSSDLSRAYETARILSEEKFEILQDKNLREVNLGVGEGLTHAEVEKLVGSEFREKWAANTSDNWDMRFPGGESKREVVERIRKSIFHYLDLFSGHTVLFVCHGYAIRSLVFSLSSQVQTNFFVPNCALVPFGLYEGELHYLGPSDPLQLIVPMVPKL